MQTMIRRRLACALATLIFAAALYEGDGPARAHEARPAGAGCGAVRAQIRYDSGRTLRYCSAGAMFAQLAAQEQPGRVRAAQVLDGGGRWLDARHAVYPHGARRLDYRQMLAACARAACD
ncbi:hypothetical protein [Duganella margarita]|uniref:hypothetical protein n=1 Tax=Duganella margarita TaxID=2692170 RepID=UPI0019265AA5|nr:hypothetical protein [Duganella margarita]